MTIDDLRVQEAALKPHASEISSHQQEGEAARPKRKLNRARPNRPGGGSSPATIGQRLVSSRLRLNLTQAEVASKVTIRSQSGNLKNIDRPLSRNAYCMYERDAVPPSVKTIEDLAHALDVSVAWLAYGIGDPDTRNARERARSRSGRRAKAGNNGCSMEPTV